MFDEMFKRKENVGARVMVANGFNIAIRSSTPKSCKFCNRNRNRCSGGETELLEEYQQQVYRCWKKTRITAFREIEQPFNIILDTCVQKLWFIIVEIGTERIEDRFALIKASEYRERFGLVLISEPIRPAHCLTSIQKYFRERKVVKAERGNAQERFYTTYGKQCQKVDRYEIRVENAFAGAGSQADQNWYTSKPISIREFGLLIVDSLEVCLVGAIGNLKITTFQGANVVVYDMLSTDPYVVVSLGEQYLKKMSSVKFLCVLFIIFFRIYSGTVIKEEVGLTLENAGSEVFGLAAKVVLTKDTTTIVGDGSTEELIYKWVA
ncbi:Chaperonin Cpn60 [Artemisia annua]|uniref:Chaperonin Cpn60 n=1 Tax=Artemisia annua TaxID=35608 RepID=A0A2U1NRA2_ARTAN|nr:Chaperonin Cpn60 [Artemisia annua]